MTEPSSPPDSILLVDDNATNLQVLYQTLETVGCKLLIAKNGESALSIAGKARPSLILLDIMMPGIDGFEVCRRLKGDPATAAIPIIFLSALDRTADKVRGLKLGAVDYVSKPFQPEEVIARVNTHLTIHRLNREIQHQRDRLEHELKVVSEVQRGLLPRRLPSVPGLRLAVFYATSRYAGGDYYDLAELPGGRLALLVADAEGHSAPAAVMMAMTCALFRSYPGEPVEAGAVIDYINTHLCKVNESSFVTAVYAVLDPGARTLHLARAGHPHPVVYRPSEQRTFELTCDGVFPMGWDRYDGVPTSKFDLLPGDRLLFYTDGVSERFNPSGEQYGERRLQTQLQRGGREGPEELLRGMMEDVERFAGGRPADDDQLLAAVSVD
jgi:sigma-B regulation protein RsbU (phosphoserine phosphatase)